MGRRPPYDAHAKRHLLRFGELEAPLSDADLAQLHDSLLRLHALPDPIAGQLCARLREQLDGDPQPVLELDTAAARKVQLAVYADQSSRKRVSPALAEARLQAFRYIESQPA